MTLRVLYVCSEVYPLLKTGGLADVSAGLPPALAAAGAEVRLLLPAFPSVVAGVTPDGQPLPLGNWSEAVLLAAGSTNSLPFWINHELQLWAHPWRPVAAAELAVHVIVRGAVPCVRFDL